jgi:hypothetical protein
MRTVTAAIRRVLGLAVVSAGAVLAPAAVAGALQTPTTGQPGTTANFNCATPTAPVEPGNASSAVGSPFNESAPGIAGTHYAGNGSPSATNAGSTAAVSQYDTACRRLSS